MFKLIISLALLFLSGSLIAQMSKSDSAIVAINLHKDSSLKAMMHTDSLKIEKEYADKLKEEKLKAIAVYPFLDAGPFSGVIPVKDPTEIPDPALDYKLLFELTANNPDSSIAEINYGLTEAARIINLHVASGIPIKKIIPVLVVHAGALNAFTNDTYYKSKYKIENPNKKIIDELFKAGVKIIACGQALAFFEISRESLLPPVKVTLSAKTALSYYRLKGFVPM